MRNGRKPVGPYLKFLSDHGWADAYVDMFQNATGKKGGLNFAAVSPLPDEAYCDNWIARNAAKELKNFSQEAPWYLTVNFAGPHDPYDVTPSMKKAWKDVDFPDPWNALPEEGVLERRQNYAAMIENIDARIGELIQLVQDRGELDSTLIVYSSDHGEILGDHNRWQKAVWQEGSSHVPLIIAGPGVGQGEVSESLVSLHDLAATFVDVANAPPLKGADAASLMPVLTDPSHIHREVVTSALADWRMAVKGPYKLVMQKGQPPRLFDLVHDVEETKNLALSMPDRVEELRQILDVEAASLKREE